MRISGGASKGRSTVKKSLVRKLSAAKKLRPTSSKVREAIFDILRGRIEGASFLDLYAGTGTVGFEALSRGAVKATFVEKDETMVREIKRNAEALGFMADAKVVRREAYEFITEATGRERFDIIFIDPPYGSEEIERVLPVIAEKDLLAENGILVAEHFSKKRLPEAAGNNIKMRKSYRYGDTMLTLYRKSIE